MKYHIDSYVVVDNSNDIIALDNGIKCQQMARKMNSSSLYREDCKPFRAVKLTATFTV